MHHDTVSADVYPAFFGIASDHQIIRADVAPAVELVPARHRKFENVDFFALLNVLEERAGGNGFSGQRSDLFHLPAPRLNKLDIA